MLGGNLDAAQKRVITENLMNRGRWLFCHVSDQGDVVLVDRDMTRGLLKSIARELDSAIKSYYRQKGGEVNGIR